MFTVQVVPLDESQPLQPEKIDSMFGVTVRVTAPPLLKAAEQVPPQLMPAGFDVIVPSPRIPDFWTVSMYCTMKLAALVAVPAVVVTLIGPLLAPAGTVV